MSLEIGSKVGDYEIVSTLGAGGMGKVFKVRNVISDRVEAMKVLLPDLEHEPELADRFIREIKVQASLQHPNIAALHTALRVDNQLLMFMELVEGITLEQRLQQGPIPLGDGVNYISQVLDALGYAHQHGVIHRDIKPANMMLTPNGTVKLMDFGIAKAAADRKLTMTGTTMGSLYYMSPEQIKGIATLDARSDLYSVGVSLYEIVTGKKPFDGDSQFAIMAAHLEKTPPPPITLDSRLPPALNDVILMSIGKDPAQRFQSAQAFAAALGSVRQSLGVPAPAASATAATTMPLRAPMQAPASRPAPAAETAPPPLPETQPAPPKSGMRWLWVGAGALATALALIAVIQFGPWRKTSAQTNQPATPVAAPADSTASQPQPAAPPAQEPQTASAPPADQTAVSPPANTPPASANPDTQKPGVKRGTRQAKSSQPSGQNPGGPASQPAGSAQPVSDAAANTAPQQAAPAKPAGPDPAVLQELRERLVQLSARAGAVRNSLANLKRAQAASGMSLRGDMAAAESRMNSLLDGANSALNANDAPATKKFIDGAEAEVEKLEKFLGI